MQYGWRWLLLTVVFELLCELLTDDMTALHIPQLTNFCMLCTLDAERKAPVHYVLHIILHMFVVKNTDIAKNKDNLFRKKLDVKQDVNIITNVVVSKAALQ